MQEAARVVPGVHLVHVAVDGPEVTADVFGSEPVVMAEVAFTVEDVNERRRLVRTLDLWNRLSRRLTLIQGEDGVVSLVDEEGVFDAALR